MPVLVLTTNVKVQSVQDFVLDFSKFGAEVLGSPEGYISINYNHDEALSFAGTFEPAFLLVITLLNNINPDANEKHSAAFFDYFKAKLGVAGNRGYITFNDPGRAYLGFQGTTFATIFKKV
ncbi:Tautomerase/MIF [Gautieria morchelliformis]|nr:Tautomerase/MIF [Gautieria morchelliformis]